MEVNNLTCLLIAMKNCEQMPNINIYEHGLMVNKAYLEIITALELGQTIEGLPNDLIELYRSNVLLDYNLMLQYQILHDCGKPLCRELGDDGRVHFPNHARLSSEQIRKFLPQEIDLQFLIEHDMDFHTLKVEELVSLSKTKYGFSLYLTSWAELFANASLFGGIDTVSFKIKRKKLIKSFRLFRV